MVGLENLDELRLRDDSVSFFIERHEGELKLVLFPGTSVVGDGDEELRKKRERFTGNELNTCIYKKSKHQNGKNSEHSTIKKVNKIVAKSY